MQYTNENKFKIEKYFGITNNYYIRDLSLVAIEQQYYCRTLL